MLGFLCHLRCRVVHEILWRLEKVLIIFWYSRTYRMYIPTLDVTFLVFWFNDFYLRLSGILCGITSSLRIRKKFFDFPWNKLVRQLFRFHIIHVLKKNLKNSAPGEDWTHNLVSWNLLLYQLSHHVYWYQLPFHTSFYM